MLAQHVGECVRRMFTDTIFVENPERKHILSTDIGGVTISEIPESNLILEVKARTKSFIYEKPEKRVLKKIWI